MSTRHQVALDRVRDVMGETVRGLMAEHDVTDIILNPALPGEPHGRLWVSRLGREREAIGIMSAEQAMRLIGAVASSMNVEATEATPSVQGHLITDGARFQGCIPPIVPGPFFAIRKHASAVFPLQSYVDKGQMTVRQKAVIEDAIERRLNILPVGGTGSGKTTLVNSILHAIVQIHPHHRIFGAEDTIELKCTAADQTFMCTSAGITIADLIKIGMRSFPDRIIIGEARRGPEMLETLTAWNSGHEGGLGTIHSNTAKPEAALERIEDMLMQVTSNPMHRMIARTVNVIICLDRINGLRRVTQIVSVLGHDGQNYQLKTET